MNDAREVGFELDGRPVSAAPGESIWEVARRLGVEIPHLCHRPEPGYRSDGNCRACMVEIEGERVLAASCIRKPTPGMKVSTCSPRAESARRMIFELLLADQPALEQAHDPKSAFLGWSRRVGIEKSRFPARHHAPPAADRSHPAMAVHLDSCIHCNLCVRACREVQVNDVIGMSGRGSHARIVFDMADPMGRSTCVACGECVQACPTGALFPATRLDESGLAVQGEERAVESVCPYCGVGCRLAFHVVDERILYVEGRNGPANHNRLCVKGRFGFDYVQNNERLTQPWIRRPDAPKRADDLVDPRDPSSRFRPASWEEALDAAAAGFARIRDAHGPRSLAGFGSAKGSNEEAYLFQKLVRTGFGSNNVDHCTRLCHASSVAALLETIGSGAVTAPFEECARSEVILVIGANPTVNHPVAATFIKNAAKRGATLIVADPRGQALSRHARYKLRFRPGTDVALLNAIIHVIIEEGLYDRGYVDRFTEGFDALAERIRPFSPEAMAPLCGIDAATLREVGRTFGRAESAMIFWGMGISQHIHGTDNSRCLISLALITGNVGRPGSGLHPLRGQNNVQGASDVGLIPMMYPDYQRVAKPETRRFFEDLWGRELDPNPGLTVVEIMDAVARREIRGLYIMGENPAMSDPDVAHARQALATLDHLVVQEIFLTETAFHADVILPASAFPEKLGTFTNTDRRVQLGRPAVRPPGEARQDLEILQELARRLGLDWSYRGPADVYAEMRRSMPTLAGISWERLEREGAVTYPCDDEREPGRAILFADGFPTESRRGKLVPANVTPPDEVPDDEYPFILSTGRQLEHWHTGAMTRRATVLDRIEPGPTVQIHPSDLERMGLKPGDPVRVSTRRGSIELATRADRDTNPGLIFIPFAYFEAAANLLTNPALDPFGKIPEFKFCAAKVEPVASRSAEPAPRA
ncbi:MAG: formate dehydrogenase subunit alpha [Isosphaeraceae bacterium]|nr:formate dehydrogenase subunit alpha [Isosphaeraceae bacterium]